MDISDFTIDNISPLDGSNSPLISIVGGIVKLDHVKISDISSGFSSIISILQATSTSATNISFLALKNAENLLNSVSS